MLTFTLLPLLLVAPQQNVDDLVIDVAKDGSCKIYSRVFVSPQDPWDLETLRQMFEDRSKMVKYQRKPGDESVVTYTVVVRLDLENTFEAAQKILVTGNEYGGVVKFRLEIRDCDETVDLILSPPRGLAYTQKEIPPRVLICARGNTQEHLSNRSEHAKDVLKDGSTCSVCVEKVIVGELTSKDTEGSNAKVIAEMAAKAAELTKQLPPKMGIVFDADEETPVLFAVQTLKALWNQTGREIEITASPLMAERSTIDGLRDGYLDTAARAERTVKEEATGEHAAALQEMERREEKLRGYAKNTVRKSIDAERARIKHVLEYAVAEDKRLLESRLRRLDDLCKKLGL